MSLVNQLKAAVCDLKATLETFEFLVEEIEKEEEEEEEEQCKVFVRFRAGGTEIQMEVRV
ncbi:MAG: hypothetical protein GTO02_05770 [Candidatus Dadabacteria bacterium]|nr:hypothetical protein [Candidatus Dadabacteria bacterium]